MASIVWRVPLPHDRPGSPRQGRIGLLGVRRDDGMGLSPSQPLDLFVSPAKLTYTVGGI